jgi:hypothetical protein
MKRILLPILASAGILFSLPLAAPAATPPNAAQMAKLQYLLGTWHCAWKSGGQSGTEDQVFQTALDGAWLSEKEIVQDASGQPVVQSIHYTGYDPAKKLYMHVGPDADGTYELAESPDADRWHNPGTSNVFIHTKVSDTERTLSETDSTGGKTVSISMTCDKV